MTDGHNFSAGDLFNVRDKGRDVVSPLGPRIDVATLPWTVAMSSQVQRIRAHTVLRHPVRETGVAAPVIAEAVQHCKRDRSALLWPGSI